jgi:ribosome biogenesis protein YTM1
MAHNEAATQVRIALSTRDTQLSLPENTGPILVPTNFRRYALSTLVNGLLQSEKPTPLEFLVNGTYLRTSLDDYLTANGISAETTLTLEYVRARIPPVHVASFEHDDWVSSVDVLSQETQPGHERILSASFDGHLRIWDPSSRVVATTPAASAGGHTSSIKCARFISPTQIISSSMDRTIRLWTYSPDSETLTPKLELYGHKASVDSIRHSPKTHRILSASQDSTISLWSTRKSDAPPAPAHLLPNATSTAKRRKLNPSITVPQRGPLATFTAHGAPVSGADFDAHDPTVGYSTSWDRTLRTWDLTTSTLVDTRTTSNPLFSLSQLPQLHLLAAGTSNKTITLIDPRDSAVSVSAMTLRGHSNIVTCLARDPESEYGLVSGSHDGTVRVWDVRSARKGKEGVVGESVFVIERESQGAQERRRVGGEGVKVFGVCWDARLGILSASEDKRVQINRGEGLLPVKE